MIYRLQRQSPTFWPMRISTLVAVVLLLGGCVALAATNPTKQEYRKFLEAKLAGALDKTEHARSRDAEIVRNILKTNGPLLIESVVGNNTLRRNYGLFSIFETRVLGANVSFLGIWGTFIPLTDVDDLTRALGRMMFTPSPS